MTGDRYAEMAFLMLAMILPLSALVSRRLPLGETARMVAIRIVIIMARSFWSRSPAAASRRYGRGCGRRRRSDDPARWRRDVPKRYLRPLRLFYIIYIIEMKELSVMADAMPSPTLPDLARLVAIMARLRDPVDGCPWDVAQDFASVAPYTIEEAYEVADACQRGDMADLKGELGDLLFQVVFHSRIAEEAGAFALADVVTAISDKMERRHPHVFADGSGGPDQWERIKAAERADATPDASALAGVALALPALTRAEKLQKRAARTGFDWPDATGARAKIVEEMEEVATASSDAGRADEIGDLLFAVVNWARKLGIEPEAALRAANAKFERRFRAMETLQEQGFAGLSLDEKEMLWQRVKRQEAIR